jgi:hypothetical protein
MHTTIAIDPDLLPTDDEVEAYRHTGWYVSRPLFTDEQLDAAVEGSEAFYRGGLERCGPALPEWVRPAPPYEGLRKHDYANFARPELDALVRAPVLAAVAARLAAVAVIRLWHSQLLYKPPEAELGDGNVGWHTDRHYWRTCSSSSMLTAWIPFHDVDERIGTITMGGRDPSLLDAVDHLSFFDRDVDAQEERIRAAGARIERVPLVLRRGQVSFHAMHTVHGSGPNRAAEPRRSMAVHLQDGANHWVHRIVTRRSLPYAALHDLDRWVRRTGRHGVPDYADPDWCPALHERGGDAG